MLEADNGHLALRRLNQQATPAPQLPAFLYEDHPTQQHKQQHGGNTSESVHNLTESSDLYLPHSCVSLPIRKDSFVSLRQQGLEDDVVSMNNESCNSTATKNWRQAAIRRNLPKQKELVLSVSGLPSNLPENAYLDYAHRCIPAAADKAIVGPVFSDAGCLFATFRSGTAMSSALRVFSKTPFYSHLQPPHLLLLPFISLPNEQRNPLLVFINARSGERQGLQLQQLLQHHLNPHQIFLLEEGGALPGLFAFRKVTRFRVLICGGDGTVGWVLSHLELLQDHLKCPRPNIALLPVGTGNDLARVLGFGPGWSGENVASLLAQVADAERCEMDRWNVIIDSNPMTSSSPTTLRDSRDSQATSVMTSPLSIVQSVQTSKAFDDDVINLEQPATSSVPTSSFHKETVKVHTMNNYLGIGIDAELSLAFHLSREHNPDRCTSRLRNKALYFKAGVKKMTSKSTNLNQIVQLEVDHEVIELPSIKGLIFLNISSWAAGTKPWGSATSRRFQPPSIGDGLLEVIGVGGVPHMSQIYSGLRSATRIAQGQYIKLVLKSEVAVQIDGEPWTQSPGTFVISLSPYRPSMLRSKGKRKKFPFSPSSAPQH